MEWNQHKYLVLLQKCLKCIQSEAREGRTSKLSVDLTMKESMAIGISYVYV